MDTLLQLMEVYGYAAMFVAMVAENANIPIPSEVVLGFAGFLISQHIFDFWTTFIIRRDRLNPELLARFVWRPSSALEIRQIYFLQ